MIRLDFTPVVRAPSLALTAPGLSIALSVSGLSIALSVPNVTIVQSTAAISADPGNRAVAGTDGGVYVRDDLVPDPLAYYILAKA